MCPQEGLRVGHPQVLALLVDVQGLVWALHSPCAGAVLIRAALAGSEVRPFVITQAPVTWLSTNYSLLREQSSRAKDPVGPLQNSAVQQPAQSCSWLEISFHPAGTAPGKVCLLLPLANMQVPLPQLCTQTCLLELEAGSSLCSALEIFREGQKVPPGFLQVWTGVQTEELSSALATGSCSVFWKQI